MLSLDRLLKLVDTLPNILKPIALGCIAIVAVGLFLLGLALPLLVTIAIIWIAVTVLG